MNADFLARKFQSALPYRQYVETGNPEQQRRWNQVYDAAAVAESARSVIREFKREMKIVIISGVWCGDCVQQCPLIARLAECNERLIDLRLLDRDKNMDLADQFKLCGGHRVPTVLMLAEDFELCSIMGDRTLHRYRALAQKYLAPACETGLAGPDPQEISRTMGDWCDEMERVQWMLRLSPRLRQKHGD